MSFSGFSEDDIRKISGTQGGSKLEKELPGPQKPQIKKVTFGTDIVRAKDIRTQPKIKPSASHTNSAEPIPEGAKLSVVDDLKPSPKPTNSNTNNNTNSRNSTPGNVGQASALASGNQILTNKAKVLSNNNEKRNMNLDEFEARQKLIEEQNRKRKELLVKALADRTKQTREEAQRLGQIQEEFAELDAILSKDVKILRRLIELISVDCMESQERYKKIEKEYLETKILLQQKLEQKEMLTKHLCTIIEKNEERKAEKLTELLNKLEVKQEVVDETLCEKPDTSSIIIVGSGAHESKKCDSNSQSEMPTKT